MTRRLLARKSARWWRNRPTRTPTYTLTGKEMYVRAKVTSSKPHPNPYAKGDVEVAWTQPVVP